ncbi:uncharacterized protein LOC141525685 [Cotesia typhae]|uniref:uncharacterized protein LOC141525685 n=1 Tax=Cotesia typhae TaxID=2053667 RepID=UPI003D686B4A
MNKGSDQAAFTVGDLDEVTKYEAGRYISTSEAVWRILSFPIHERFPPVMHLAVHLENGQRAECILSVLPILNVITSVFHPNDFGPNEVRGPESFTALRTIKDVIYPIFQEACRVMGLLEDDAHWDQTLAEVSISDSSYKIRELFAVMLVFCQVGDPIKLWDKYRDNFTDDIKRRMS